MRDSFPRPARGKMPEPDWTEPLLSTVDEMVSCLSRGCSELKRDANAESLHSVRKSSRRLRLTLRLLQSVVSHSDGNLWRKRLKGFRNSLSEARDLDVQSVRFEKLAEQGAEGAEEVLEALRRRRAEQRDSILAAAAALLDDGILEAVQNRIARRLTGPRRRRMGLTRRAVSRDMATRTRRLADKLSSSLPKLQRASGPRAHHKVRIAARKLRYALEFLDRTGEAPLDEWIEEVLRLQTELGHLQDSHVMRRTLDGLERAGLLPKRAAGLKREAEGSCTEALALSRQAAASLAGGDWLSGLRAALDEYAVGQRERPL